MIRFNQPRYILPLILLPFIYIFYYLFDLSETDSKVDDVKVETASINATLPDPFLDEDNLKDKFDAFQEAHKNKRKSSAIREIDRREESKSTETAILVEGELPVYPSRPVERKQIYTPATYRKKDLDSYEAQMELFKAQMSYVDSLIQVEEEIEQTDQLVDELAITEVIDSLKLEQVGSQKKEVSRSKQQIVKAKPELSGQFNTIAKQENSQFIRAVIDEEIKVRKSSRVRLRMLEAVDIGKYHIRKGQYIYGLIAAFKPQRVEINISSILVDDQILEVELDIYDLDGMKGLYVPESSFGALLKSVGENAAGSQQLSIDQPANSQLQLLTDLAKDAFQTTTRSASKVIRKQKAKLKYNTQVYLVNNSK